MALPKGPRRRQSVNTPLAKMSEAIQNALRLESQNPEAQRLKQMLSTEEQVAR
jgi:hypothetical protein